MKKSITFFLLLGMCLVLAPGAFAQDNTAAIAEMIKQKKWKFQATTMSGRGARQLNGTYHCTLNADTVICDLPYAGRVYTATVATDGSPMSFTAKEIKYTIKDRKKGGWQITIQTRDLRNDRRLSFIISPDGTASLNISAVERESISYNGRIIQP